MLKCPILVEILFNRLYFKIIPTSEVNIGDMKIFTLFKYNLKIEECN